MSGCLQVPEIAQLEDAIDSRKAVLEQQYAAETDPTQKEMISLAIDSLNAGESKINSNACPLRV